MEIKYNKNEIKKQLAFINECVPCFKNNKMFFYFPFNKVEEDNLGEINKQIQKDEDKFKIDTILKTIKNKWREKEESVF